MQIFTARQLHCRFAGLIVLSILMGALSGCGIDPNAQEKQPLLEKAGGMLTAGNMPEARKLFDQFLKDNKGSMIAYTQVCDLSTSYRHPEVAIDYVHKGFTINPKATAREKAVLFTSEAIAWNTSGDMQKALTAHKAAYDLLPDEPMMINNLGYAYAEAHGVADLDKALALATRAVQLARTRKADDLEIGTYMDSMGWIYYCKGNMPEAVSTLESAVLMNPNQAEIHYHLAMAYKQSLRVDDARIELNRAISLQPKNTTLIQALRELEKRPTAKPEPVLAPAPSAGDSI